MSDDDPTKPPTKIRATKLQEAQLLDVKAIEARCAQMFYEAGYGEDHVRPRSEIEIAALTKNHDVLVAEADHQPAGYLAWADQAPGVAWLPIFKVAPAMQRLGIGTYMLRDLGERIKKLGLETVVTPCFERAPWALAFLAVRGFEPVEPAGSYPEKLQQWLEARAADAVAPGQKLWWAKSDGLGTIPGLPRP